MKNYYVYILANKPKGVLYIGRTESLAKRISDHKNSAVSGFTQKYNVKVLVHFETYNNAEDAAQREKRMKSWKRDWKINLIEENNPEWKDLYFKLNE